MHSIYKAMRCQLGDAMAASGAPGRAVFCSPEGVAAACEAVTGTLDGHANPGPLQFKGGWSASCLW